MQPTRRQILDYLRSHGKGSVKELGDLLGLTSTGIRQHLTILERDSLIEGHEERGRVGRPALVYSLTPLGDGVYPKKYATLAALLLDEIRSLNGDPGVQELLQRAAKRKAEPYLGRVAGMDLPARVSEVARIIEAEGCLVSTSSRGGAHFINRLTCPYPDVAHAHKDLCYLDTQFVGYLLESPVSLDSCIVRGDPACIYRIQPR
ncbi:MAG TPA: helix-turn-helix domain-containing protein [Dehalococcoidia bacterium]|nr:helix-turn-helix domain-containing protein [Dehalococcoidia bacterium]